MSARKPKPRFDVCECRRPHGYFFAAWKDFRLTHAIAPDVSGFMPTEAEALATAQAAAGPGAVRGGCARSVLRAMRNGTFGTLRDAPDPSKRRKPDPAPHAAVGQHHVGAYVGRDYRSAYLWCAWRDSKAAGKSDPDAWGWAEWGHRESREWVDRNEPTRWNKIRERNDLAERWWEKLGRPGPPSKAKMAADAKARTQREQRARAESYVPPVVRWFVVSDEPAAADLAALKISWPCTRADLTRAFRRRALETHPDRGGRAADFIAARAAYERLAKMLSGEGVRP